MKKEKYFDKWAETYSRGEYPLFEQWNIDKLFEQIELKDDDVVLDLGTGNGKLLREVGKRDFACRLIGIDFSKEMLDEAREKLKQENLNAQLIQRTLPDIGLKKESVDYVISNIALHHVKDKKKLYSAIYNVLKKGGKLVYVDSHDKPDEWFDKAKKEWLKKEEKFAKAYKKSADDTWQEIPAEIREKHPPEYHITTEEAREFLREAGFKNIEIIPSPSYFIVVKAEK
ncbi:class I SAM-dependent methyltransferase [Candidatus Woesearchaeota archaeon]|nr:class I SAM-dependent methyltransferase [Candidatus Woesearchaeota archaeon]